MSQSEQVQPDPGLKMQAMQRQLSQAMDEASSNWAIMNQLYAERQALKDEVENLKNHIDHLQNPEHTSDLSGSAPDA